jgi:PIN domain nuclease of toxin-antitoxin system
LPGLVADTHATLWYLARSPNLSAAAFASMQRTVAGGDPILVPTITIVEVIYLVEKGRVPKEALARIYDHLDLPDSGMVLTPLSGGVARAVERISRDTVPDMPDRLIAATALHLGLPLVTHDRNIRSSGIPTIW